MGNWDQRKEVGNDGKCDEVCEECCDADGEISKDSLSISSEELHKDVHLIYVIYSRDYCRRQRRRNESRYK